MGRSNRGLDAPIVGVEQADEELHKAELNGEITGIDEQLELS